MEIKLEPGTYVVAVSGGVDSMALLDMLRRQEGLKLIVAHFDHGVRHDSELDRQIVQATAEQYGLPFVFDYGRLGPGASEDAARRARYAFLRRVQEASGAQAVVTAHHQDDLLETAILNLIRGTNRRGLTSLRSHHHLRRPLLDVPKAALQAYARSQGLIWREDSTNQDIRYLRNYIRHHVLPRFSDVQRQKLLGHLKKARETNDEIEHLLTNHLHLHPRLDTLDRHQFVMLPHAVAREVMATWLKRQSITDISRKMLERLTAAAKTFSPEAVADVDKTHVLAIGRRTLALKGRER